jgi:plasmid stabilization system protein ParE
VAADRLSAADRLTEQVHDAVELLARFPGMGHFRADVPHRRYRFWAVQPYVIAYRFTSRTLTIVRIVHGARNFRTLFARR